VNDREKQEHERRVFAEFAASASLPVDEASIRSGERGKPDIFCKLAGMLTYFELARVSDSKMNKLRIRTLLAAVRRGAPVMQKVDASEFGLPERDVLREKLKNNYETDGAPVDLLLYYDVEDFKALGAIPPIVGDEFFRDTMGRTLESSHGPFQRIWVYERYTKKVLWRFPE